ncbi:MAG: LysR family transcriptional regulator [Xanthobacteraceae bacterium]|nr:MAG: LysR family transcriptional regulator [Xanthobacteraceae bacterium]
MNWDDLRIFLAVARTRTLSAAAGQLNVDHATVGRRIARLERGLNAKLFQRSLKGYQPTPAAEHLLRAAEMVESTVNSGRGVIEGGDLSLSGMVRIGAPDGFGTMFLAPRFGVLNARHPDLEIDLIATSRLFSLSKRETDIAISLALPPRGRVIGRKLTDYHLGFFASPGYLARHDPIRAIEDLRPHAIIGYIEDLIYAPELNYLPLVAKFLRPKFRSANLIAQFQAVLAGHGLAVLPSFMAAATPGLTPVLADRVALTRTFYMLIHEDDRHLSRIRVTSDFIVEQVEANAGLFLPERPPKPRRKAPGLKSNNAGL